MSWVRVDDSFPWHPKVLGLPAHAVALWLRALCWSNQQKTDGVIPSEAIAGLALPGCSPRTQVALLVRANLWTDRAQGGWEIHGFLDYQASAAERKAVSRAGRERKEASRKARLGDASGEATARHVTSPSPSPSPSQISDPPLAPPTPGPDPSPAARPPKAPRAKPRSSCPASVDPDAPAWLEARGIPPMSPNAEGREVAKMLDHHRGKGSLMADWSATWRTWRRNAVEFGKLPAVAAVPPKRPARNPADIQRELAALAEESARQQADAIRAIRSA